MQEFLRSERGGATAEYILVIAMIALSVAISVTSIGNAIGDALGRGGHAVAAAGDDGDTEAGGTSGGEGKK